MSFDREQHIRNLTIAWHRADALVGNLSNSNRPTDPKEREEFAATLHLAYVKLDIAANMLNAAKAEAVRLGAFAFEDSQAFSVKGAELVSFDTRDLVNELRRRGIEIAALTPPGGE